MKPLFCRIGSKRKQVKMLTRLFPVHDVYVEPFFGGGAVFFGKTPSSKEVVNDLDAKLVQDYKRIVDAPTDTAAYPNPKGLAAQRRFLSGHESSVGAKVVESILRRCNGFGGKYIDDPSSLAKPSSSSPKVKHIGFYKGRLANATILNQDYRKVIKKYDSAKTFFFLDPPYEMSEGVDYAKGSETFDFEELAKCLRDIKGDVLITINDSPHIRKAFDGFKLYPYVVRGHHSETSPIGAKDRKELLITNYTLPQNWRSGGSRRGGMEGKVYTALQEVKMRPNGCVHSTYEFLRPYAPKLPPFPFPSGHPVTIYDAAHEFEKAYKISAYNARTTSSENVAKDDYADDDYDRVNLLLQKIAASGLPAMIRIPKVMKGGKEVSESHVVAFVRKSPSDPTYVFADTKFRTGSDICSLQLQEWKGTEDDVPTFAFALPDIFVVIQVAPPAPPALTPAEQLAQHAATQAKAASINFKGYGRMFGPDAYLRAVRAKAKKEGYDPKCLKFAVDGTHKFEYKTPAGQTVRFGRVGYGDFILWTHQEREGKVPKGTASSKRSVFHKSHEAMKGDWKTNPYSPNRLALDLLW